MTQGCDDFPSLLSRNRALVILGFDVEENIVAGVNFYSGIGQSVVFKGMSDTVIDNNLVPFTTLGFS